VVTGKEYPAVEFTLDRERVERFARAVGADPAAGVPPTFAAVYALFTTVPQLWADPEAKVDLARLVHSEQEFEWSRHPQVGERVVARGRVTDDAERRGMRLLGFETEVEGICRSKIVQVIRP
jgi:MaoC dehydratase-like protein